MKYHLGNNRFFCPIFIVLIFTLYTPVSAQENWGPAESIIPVSWLDFCPIRMYGFSCPAISTNDSLMFLNFDCVYTHGIVSSVFENGEWQLPLPVHDQLNDLWPASLFFYDQVDTLLYFVADWGGGYGGEDIWAIQLINGVWGNSFNLGPVINTGGNESSPSSPDDDSKLYFIRDGTIFYSEKINGQYSNPIALPPLINSDLTELFPSISRDGQKLYFNRYGIHYLPDTMMVSYYLNGEWQEPFPLNGYINCNHYNPNCPMISCISFGPSFSHDGAKMYFTHLAPFGQYCEPVYEIRVSELVTDIEYSPPYIPSSFSISAYPNPFNNRTNISITGNLESISNIAIYDITGRKIISFAPASQITWDGTDDQGAPVSSGIYFVRVGDGDIKKSLRITLLK